ncbi:MAG: flagellin [Proteobacteria bacterium]|nr:flagellin [Pseudomonadota bacterium]
MAGSINSLNTNEGAYRALSSTRSQSAALQQAQKRLQTGLRVADAADDASTFAVAQGLRGDLQSFTAVQSSLANGTGLGSVTQAALGQVSDLSNQLQQRLTQLSDGSISAQQRATYSADAQALTSQIQTTIQQAGFNGQNLLQAGAGGTSFLADTNGASISVSGQGQVGTGATTLQGAINTSSAATSQASLGALQNFQNTIAQAAANNAADTRGLVQQSNLTNSISDAVTIGLGAQVDADIGASAAQASARQVGRQLAFTSLGLANSQPSALLGLTR